MGTSSSVSVKMSNGKIKTIYGKFDGYESGVGAMLRANYASQERAEALVALGDFSSLEASIDCPEGHSFENKINGHTVFYGRDRGETGVNARSYDDTFMAMYSELQEYNYFWNGSLWVLLNRKGEERVEE